MNFGRTSLPGSSGRFSVGALECAGRRSETIAMPTNCQDLFFSGHTLSAFYPVLLEDEGVNSNNQTKMVYCDFTRPLEEMTTTASSPRSSVDGLSPPNSVGIESLIEKIDRVQWTLTDDIEQRTNKV